MDQSEARFKLVRWGRRTGKTVWAGKAAVVGHGPIQPDGTPRFPGVCQGWDVIWLARDYPQAGIIWREWVVPRFAGVKGVRLNHAEHTVQIGTGHLLVRSAENVLSLKGSGARLRGVVVEEAAWLPLEAAWKDVIRPALMDNEGWSVWISTPNGGQDGNTDKLAPSFFNRVCTEILEGKRGPEWAQFHATARDNPTIARSEFDAMLEDYPEGSIRRAQEIEAELVLGGEGLAFPEWSSEVHVVQYEAPANWGWAGGFDWGYSSPGCCLIGRFAPDRDILLRYETYFKKETACEVGERIAKQLRGTGQAFPDQFPIFTDPSVFNPLDGRPSYADEVQRGLRNVLGDRAPVMVPASMVRTENRGIRESGWLVLHEALRWRLAEDGTRPRHLDAALKVHKACPNLIRTLPALPVDPRHPEDVDTTAEDHAADALRYLLQSRIRRPDQREGRDVPAGVHPGFTVQPDQTVVRNSRDGSARVPLRRRFLTGVQRGRDDG